MKAALVFQEKKTLKNFLTFLKRSVSYISGNGNLKIVFIFEENKLSYISGSNFPSSKTKFFTYFSF